jgi:hypothetical protein
MSEAPYALEMFEKAELEYAATYSKLGLDSIQALEFNSDRRWYKFRIDKSPDGTWNRLTVTGTEALGRLKGVEASVTVYKNADSIWSHWQAGKGYQKFRYMFEGKNKTISCNK